MRSLLLLALGTSVLAASPAPASYSGAWTLDLQRSTGLPEYYSRVKSHSLRIAQTDSGLTVDVTVDAGGPSPDHIALAYPLNGRESVTESAIRGPNGQVMVPTRLQATTTDDGGIHITIRRTIAMGGPPMEVSTTEDWSLSPDQRELLVHRVDDSPRGKVDAQMVFVRR